MQSDLMKVYEQELEKALEHMGVLIAESEDQMAIMFAAAKVAVKWNKLKEVRNDKS